MDGYKAEVTIQVIRILAPYPISRKDLKGDFEIFNLYDETD